MPSSRRQTEEAAAYALPASLEMILTITTARRVARWIQLPMGTGIVLERMIRNLVRGIPLKIRELLLKLTVVSREEGLGLEHVKSSIIMAY